MAPGATEGAGGVFSQHKSDIVFHSTVGGRSHLMIFQDGAKNGGGITEVSADEHTWPGNGNGSISLLLTRYNKNLRNNYFSLTITLPLNK